MYMEEVTSNLLLYSMSFGFGIGVAVGVGVGVGGIFVFDPRIPPPFENKSLSSSNPRYKAKF